MPVSVYYPSLFVSQAEITASSWAVHFCSSDWVAKFSGCLAHLNSFRFAFTVAFQHIISGAGNTASPLRLLDTQMISVRA